ncbi:3620_t:CDS:2, partial [Rhizophagus irregularis]
YHLLEGLKTCLNQNKELFQTVYDIKNKQTVFYKEIKEQLSGISEKSFEDILKQDKPGYIEKHRPQWMHIYSGRIESLCNEIIKSRRYDKAKDVHTAMFDIFGNDWLIQINTTASAEAIHEFKKLRKTKRAFQCLFEADDDDTAFTLADYLSTSKEISVNTTKSIIIEELGNYHKVTSNESSEDETDGDSANKNNKGNDQSN